MSDAAPKPGSIGWIDLTVDDAPGVRDFYRDVAGWTPQDVDMGEYCDFSMTDADGTARAGVCHRRGGNADTPSGWIIYIVIEDLEASLERCTALGGRIVLDRRTAGFCVIEDPSGARAALYQAGG